MYCLQGARVGDSVYVDSLDFMDLDFVEIGDNAVIGEGTTVVAHTFENGTLRFSKVLLDLYCPSTQRPLLEILTQQSLTLVFTAHYSIKGAQRHSL